MNVMPFKVSLANMYEPCAYILPLPVFVSKIHSVTNRRKEAQQMTQQDTQCTYKINLWHLHETIVAVEQQ
jgi:hypothetical protein